MTSDNLKPPRARSKRISPQHALESFAPELLTLLERGTLSRQIIPGDYAPDSPDDPRPLERRQLDAIKSLRHAAARLNQLRNALVKVGDERGPRLYRTKVSVDPDNITLIVEPRDGDIVKLIKSAGVDTSLDTTGLDELDAALSNLDLDLPE